MDNCEVEFKLIYPGNHFGNYRDRAFKIIIKKEKNIVAVFVCYPDSCASTKKDWIKLLEAAEYNGNYSVFLSLDSSISTESGIVTFTVGRDENNISFYVENNKCIRAFRRALSFLFRRKDKTEKQIPNRQKNTNKTNIEIH